MRYRIHGGPALPGCERKRNSMKALMILTAAAVVALPAAAAKGHAVKGYIKKDGTYVAPTIATNPNSSKVDNYSSKGNINPMTGKQGTVDPYKIEAPKSKKK
jgi:hypothetical protein